MYIINSNFTIFTNAGTLTESRLKALNDVFGSSFPEVNRPNENVIAFKKGSDVLFINPEQITFISEGSASEYDIEEASELMQRASKVLELTPKTGLGIKFEAIEDTDKNVFEKSKEYVKDATEILNAKGVGFRFIIEEDSFGGDIFIEPYIRDDKKVFYNVTLETQELIDHDNLTDYINKLFKYGTEKSGSAANSLLN